MSKLDKKEEKISKDILEGKYKSLPKTEVKKYSKMAKEDSVRRKDIRKEARINIRLTLEDLSSLRDRAEEEGIAYQTLVASIIHKYLMGRFLDLQNAEAIKKILKK